jgi:hypothetical protein
MLFLLTSTYYLLFFAIAIAIFFLMFPDSTSRLLKQSADDPWPAALEHRLAFHPTLPRHGPWGNDGELL